jgi:hypothetical protein
MNSDVFIPERYIQPLLRQTSKCSSSNSQTTDCTPAYSQRPAWRRLAGETPAFQQVAQSLHYSIYAGN